MRHHSVRRVEHIGIVDAAFQHGRLGRAKRNPGLPERSRRAPGFACGSTRATSLPWPLRGAQSGEYAARGSRSPHVGSRSPHGVAEPAHWVAEVERSSARLAR